MRENTDQNNSEYGHFLRNDFLLRQSHGEKKMSCCIYPAGIYLFKANNKNTRPSCDICPKLTIKTLERRHW